MIYLCFINSISEHINIAEKPSREMRKPFCLTDLPFSMNSYDHLKGVALRDMVDNSSEFGLMNILPNIIPNVKSVEDFADIISLALEKVSLCFGSLP